MRLEERKLARREQAEIMKKRQAQKERDEDMKFEARSMNTSMSGSPFKPGAALSQTGTSSPTKSKYSPNKSRGGDTQSETESRMTGATGFQS